MCENERATKKLVYVKQNFENRATDLAAEVTRGLFQLEQASASDEEFQNYANHVIDWLQKAHEVVLEQLSAYDCDIS